MTEYLVPIEKNKDRMKKEGKKIPNMQYKSKFIKEYFKRNVHDSKSIKEIVWLWNTILDDWCYVWDPYSKS